MVIMNQDVALKGKIMRRIYMIYMLRLLVHPKTIKSALFLVMFWRSTAYVSYASVFQNSPNVFDVGREVDFARSAVMQTEATTLVLVFGAILMFGWLLRDMIHRTT